MKGTDPKRGEEALKDLIECVKQNLPNAKIINPRVGHSKVLWFKTK